MVEYDIFIAKELIFLRSRSDLRVLFVMRKKWAKRRGRTVFFPLCSSYFSLDLTSKQIF